MKYPKEVQEHIDILNKYTENDKLYQADIFHFYPKELAFPDGFYDARFFELIAFNTKTMKKRNLGKHDGVGYAKGTEIDMASVFADGSFIVKLISPTRIPHTTTQKVLLGD